VGGTLSRHVMGSEAKWGALAVRWEGGCVVEMLEPGGWPLVSSADTQAACGQVLYRCVFCDSWNGSSRCPARRLLWANSQTTHEVSTLWLWHVWTIFLNPEYIHVLA
jgi:hypothetical protein